MTCSVQISLSLNSIDPFLRWHSLKSWLKTKLKGLWKWPVSQMQASHSPSIRKMSSKGERVILAIVKIQLGWWDHRNTIYVLLNAQRKFSW